MSPSSLPPLTHPRSLIGVRNFWSLARSYGIDRGHRAHAAALLLSCMLGVPFRWFKTLCSSRLVARTPIPHVVYHSNLPMWRQMVAASSLQRTDQVPPEEILIGFYKKLLGRFFTESASLPDEQFVHVRFEELKANPVEQIERIYAALGLEGVSEALPYVQDYIQTTSSYRKNEYAFSAASLQRVEEAWDFTLSRWGYCWPESVNLQAGVR